MNKILIKSIIALILFSLVIIPYSTARAEADVTPNKEHEPIKLYYEDFLNQEDLDLKITKLLKDAAVPGVLVVHKEEYSNLAPQAIPIGQWWNWQNGKAKYNGKRNDTFGPTLSTLAGDPGIIINLDYSESHDGSHSGSFGLSDAGVNLAVGFTVNGSYSVSFTGSYKIPSIDNGKDVARANLNLKVVYANHSYTVKNASYPNGKTGTAKKPYGVYYEKVITYE